MWQTDYSAHLIPTFLIVFLTSFSISAVVIMLKHQLLSRVINREDLASVQSMHIVPTPRLGGAAVVLGIISCLAIVYWTPLERQGVIIYFVALSPILLAGLCEDLGLRVSPRIRFASAIVAGLLTSLAWGIWVREINVPGLDMILAYAPIAIPLTILAAAGVTNAFNLVDGINGLAGFISISTAASLAVAASSLGLYNIQAVSIMLCCAVAGFLCFNFPFGKIFLGDAGAYTLGHTLVWLAIGLNSISPDVTPWAILLIFFWPVADTLLAIWRRRRLGLRADQPDRLHFHQFALRYIEIRFLGRGKRAIANPIATVLLLPFVIAPQIAGIALIYNDVGAKITVAIFAFLFVAVYVFGIRRTKQMHRRRRPAQ